LYPCGFFSNMKRGPNNLPEEVASLVAYYVQKHIEPLQKRMAVTELYFKGVSPCTFCMACKTPVAKDLGTHVECRVCKQIECRQSYCPRGLVNSCACESAHFCVEHMEKYKCSVSACDSVYCSNCRKLCYLCNRNFCNSHMHKIKVCLLCFEELKK
jgi:hypothetical protein